MVIFSIIIINVFFGKGYFLFNCFLKILKFFIMMYLVFLFFDYVYKVKYY